MAASCVTFCQQPGWDACWCQRYKWLSISLINFSCCLMYKTEQFAHLQCLWCQPVMFAQFCSGYITSPSNQNTSSCHQVPLSQSCPLKGKHPSHFAEDHSLPEVRDRNHHCILFKEPYWRRKKRKGKERKKKNKKKEKLRMPPKSREVLLSQFELPGY